MVSRFRVGVIAGTHGLRGEVKVFPTTDEPRRFLDLEKVIMDTGREERTLKIRSVKFFKKFVILGFEEMGRIEDVERLKGAELLIPREEAIELEEGEYFIPDLLGLKVTTDDGRDLGVIKDVIETGANNVYDVRNEDGKSILIPAILGTSITGRAMQKGLVSLDAVNIRDYAANKHRKVDDYTYGGGAGMLMQAQPVYDACMAVQNTLEKPARVVYMTPQGSTFNQKKAQELAQEENLIILCGHYEGIDERVLEEIVTDEISIGDYVLTGGELPAMVVIDTISRLIPGVLGNGVSADTDSFMNGLLEYPQYSRPEVWRDKKVPAVLLSGDHAKVDRWRKEQSLERTRLRRPDLYEKYMKEHPDAAKYCK